MKIYTRSGDAGQTSIIGGRVDKDDLRVEAYGTVDELNSLIGLAISWMPTEPYADLRADLLEIQHELFDCGHDLALIRAETEHFKVKQEMVDRLETLIDRYEQETPEITRFILPGGSTLSSTLHLCRTVCRRAERRIVTLTKAEQTNDAVRRYLNRLSDLFFTIARVANVRENVADVEYIRSAEVFRTTRKGDASN
jgi:cob(I)alamin adenosyltransferase